MRESLRRAEGHAASLRKANIFLNVASTRTFAATALVAGGTAVHGPVVGQGIGGWQLACVLAAALALTSTISNGLSQQFKFGDRLLQGDQCVRRLRALSVQLSASGFDWAEATREFSDISKTFPEHVGL